MPQTTPGVAPPFDHGVFLLHYNRGREAFQEGRYGEARKELEMAQKMRPDDTDVLNLLGLVYFKTNALPEAEVIYRRLVRDNTSVFVLHSNLGLILFKLGKIDDAEQYLLKAIELRPNYAKSHLYLGMLYRQKAKLGLALEHLKFAGAEKLAKEVEAELAGGFPEAEKSEKPPPTPVKTQPVPVSPEPPAKKAPAEPPAAKPAPRGAEPIGSKSLYKTKETRLDTMPDIHDAAKAEAARAGDDDTQKIRRAASPPEQTPEEVRSRAAQKLQEAVDEPVHVEGRQIDLGRKIEGASKTFTLHENGFLEINFRNNVHIRRGTVSSYSGNLRFIGESGLMGTTAATMVKVEGSGRIFLYEKGLKTFLLDLNDEFIYVEGSNLLALEDSLSFRVEPIYDSTYQKKIDTIKIFGKGSLAISTKIEPLTLRVTTEYPLSISSSALVAWTGNIIPLVIDDSQLENVMITQSEDNSFRIRFEGDGIVVSEQ
jgi:tetratricopeptide (TPR) repeat protein/uncharacterized protein (AIM24 family)